MSTALWLIPILPLVGAAFNGLLGHAVGRRTVAVVGVGLVVLSFVLAAFAFAHMLGLPDRRLDVTYANWMAVGSLNVPFGLVMDPLSGLMTLVVAGIGALIHLYSVGYMWEDEGFARYFSYLNLFVFFMLTLVLGSSLPLMFVGWEGVGLCSYLLIGYYFGTDFAPDAGLKAFLTNRVGDLGVAIGMMALFAAFGSLTVGDILKTAGHLPVEVGFGVLTFATLMLFIGATGKSAQIPLYIWLPDAMAGPTPVSALIHAATMVTSGIYLVCRLAPVFSLAPMTMTTIAWVGGLTALFAATMGLFQRDIKKVLAYSTVSQLGYMFLGLGAAGFAAGFFHVFTHAWFKALLFLGAGSVIHALHHEQDLFRMGGLRSKTPITFWTMVLATFAIMGFPGFSGFFSKDEILYLAYLKSPALWVIGVLGACCTSFYMWRLMALTFWGEPRDSHAHEHAHHSPQANRAASADADGGGEHSDYATGAKHREDWTVSEADGPEGARAGGPSQPTGHSPVHESPWTMTLTLAILAVGSVLWGFWGVPEAFGGHFAIGKFLEPALTYGQVHAPHGHHEGPALLLAAVSTVLGVAAGWYGWSRYKTGPAWEEALAARIPVLHRVLLNKYYVDEGIEAALLAPLRASGRFLWRGFDNVVIDGVGVRLAPALVQATGHFAAFLQTGRVRNYALFMGLGLLGLLWAFAR